VERRRKNLNELLMLTAFIFSGLGYVGGYFSSEGKNNRSTAKRCNRKYETRPMIGEEYLRFLRHEEQSLYDKKLVDEIEAVFHYKEWVERKVNLKLLKKFNIQ
jgi:hypothetical protein